MVVLNEDIIDKIISIIDLSFDAMFFNLMANEQTIDIIYKNIRKELKNLE